MNIMTREEKTSYWMELADYDVVTAEAMYSTKRWLYVGFMCHQVLEKTLKAYWCSSQESDPPYVHNLVRLAENSGILEEMTEEQRLFLDMMMPMNIEARYPSYKSALARELNETVCGQIIERTKNLKQWIENKL